MSEEVYLSLQNEVVDIFSLLSRDLLDLQPFMVKYQSCLFSVKKHIAAAEKNPLVQKSYFLLLTLLYKLIAYTRDIYGGLGERKLTYMMLFLWNYQFPLPTALCLKHMITPIENAPPFGSWRDIKGLCLFIRQFSPKGENDPFIETCLGLMNHQLDVDYTHWNNALDEYVRKQNTGFALMEKPSPSSVGISMVAKWIPREHSSYDWLFKRAAVQWIRSFKPHYFKSCTNESQFKSALRKGSKEYRHVFSRLSREWDTLEIKQCSKQWDSIKPLAIPFSALHRQQQSLLNIHSNGVVRSTIGDRVSCATKIQKYWRATRSSNNPTFIDMGEFIKTAIRVVHVEEVRRMEIHWKHILSQYVPSSSLDMLLPIVDMSLFRDQENRFYEALGLACIVAMKSSKRIFLFDQTTHVVSIEHCTSLKEVLALLRPIYHEHHIGQNVKGVCDTLLLSMRETNLPVDEVKLMFFTSYDRIDSIQDVVQASFEHAGYVHSPFLLIWRATEKIMPGSSSSSSSFYTSSSKTFVFSGNSNYTLCRISSLPPEAWHQMNAFDFVAFLLNQPRYDIFEHHFKQLFTAPSTPVVPVKNP